MMRLVKKKAPRWGLYRILSEAEESAVKAVCGKRQAEPAQWTLANEILLEMRRYSVWLQCGCVTGDAVPMSSAKLYQDTQTLYLCGFNGQHDHTCPMYHEIKADKDTTSSGTRRKPGSKPISFRDFLPVDERNAKLKSPNAPREPSDDKTQRVRRPRLARMLLTLIEDAGLNVISPVYPLPSRPARESISLLHKVTEQHEFIRGRRLSEIVRFQPTLDDAGQEKLMQMLEQTTPWPSNKTRAFYQIFMSEKVSRESATFSNATGEYVFRPDRGISINGESQEGIRPPYWVILAFQRNQSGKIVCSEGYAHALYQRTCPVPVDSGLEKETINGIVTAVEWVLKKKGYPMTAFSLKKPLFDIEVSVGGEKGFVLPDFILTSSRNGHELQPVVIETMGYDDDEYVERKLGQHRGMRTLGKLQTDPPMGKEAKFPNHLFGILFNLK